MAHELLDPGGSPSEASRRDVWGEWPAWGFLALLWGFSFWALGRLPARVPLHWNVRGEVDGWGSPLQAALLVPILATGTYLLILALDWGRLDFRASRAMAPVTTRRVRILLPLLAATVYAYLLRARLERESDSQEHP